MLIHIRALFTVVTLVLAACGRGAVATGGCPLGHVDTPDGCQPICQTDVDCNVDQACSDGLCAPSLQEHRPQEASLVDNELAQVMTRLEDAHKRIDELARLSTDVTNAQKRIDELAQLSTNVADAQQDVDELRSQLRSLSELQAKLETALTSLQGYVDPESQLLRADRISQIPTSQLTGSIDASWLSGRIRREQLPLVHKTMLLPMTAASVRGQASKVIYPHLEKPWALQADTTWQKAPAEAYLSTLWPADLDPDTQEMVELELYLWISLSERKFRVSAIDNVLYTHTADGFIRLNAVVLNLDLRDATGSTALVDCAPTISMTGLTVAKMVCRFPAQTFHLGQALTLRIEREAAPSMGQEVDTFVELSGGVLRYLGGSYPAQVPSVAQDDTVSQAQKTAEENDQTIIDKLSDLF